jgi:hypothetical protein
VRYELGFYIPEDEILQNSSQFEAQAVVIFLLTEGVSEREIHCRFVSVYGQSVFSWKEVSL